MSFIRQSVISSALTYVGVVIGYFNLVWLFPKLFSAEQIGLLRIIQEAAILLSPLAEAGLRQSTLKFFPHFKTDRKSHKAFLSLILLGTLVTYILFLILFLVFRDAFALIFEEKAAVFISYFKIMLALILILVFTGILEAYSHSLFKVVIPNFLKEVSTRLLLTVSSVLYAFGVIDFDMVLNSLLLIYFTGLLLLALYLVHLKEIGLGFDFSNFHKRILKQLFSYSSFSMLSSVSTRIANKIDTLMITSLLGLAETGIYTTVFYIAVVIEMPRRAIVQLSIPLISSSFKKANVREIKTLYQKVSLNQLIIGYLFLIGIWANTNNLFYMMPNGEVFRTGKYIILIVGIAKLTDMLSSINGEIIVMSKYYRFNVIAITGMAVVSIICNKFFIPAFGMNGAALSVLISILLFNLAKFIFVLSKLKIQPLTIKTLHVLLIGGLIYLVSTFIPQIDNAFIDLVIRSAFIATLYLGIMLKLKISEEVNVFFDDIYSKTIGSFRK
jgi:O-antigen/teichoic acid export membrane protein